MLLYLIHPSKGINSNNEESSPTSPFRASVSQSLSIMLTLRKHNDCVNHLSHHFHFIVATSAKYKVQNKQKQNRAQPFSKIKINLLNFITVCCWVLVIKTESDACPLLLPLFPPPLLFLCWLMCCWSCCRKTNGYRNRMLYACDKLGFWGWIYDFMSTGLICMSDVWMNVGIETKAGSK